VTWLLPLAAVLALLLLLIGGGVLLLARRQRTRTGIPWGDMVFADMDEEAVNEPIMSRKLGLVGKPDMLLRRKERGREILVPVEVKSQRMPREPRRSHVLQLGAYLLLVEEVFGITPEFGILRYADGDAPIAFTPELRADVLEVASRIRAARNAEDVPRSHDDPKRCVNCGYRHACDQAL